MPHAFDAQKDPNPLEEMALAGSESLRADLALWRHLIPRQN